RAGLRRRRAVVAGSRRAGACDAVPGGGAPALAAPQRPAPGTRRRHPEPDRPRRGAPGAGAGDPRPGVRGALPRLRRARRGPRAEPGDLELRLQAGHPSPRAGPHRPATAPGWPATRPRVARAGVAGPVAGYLVTSWRR